MAVHTTTHNSDVSLEQEFQKHLSDASWKHGILDHIKHKKGQVNKSGQTGSIMCNIIKMLIIKTYCVTNQFPELPCCGTHKKPHCVRWSGKNYHMHFDPKLGHYTCAILKITCAYTQCTYMIDQPWILSMPQNQ